MCLLLGASAVASPLAAAPALSLVGFMQSFVPSADSQTPAADAEGGALVRVAGRSGEAFGPEDRAQELYVDALEKFAGGHAEWARTTLADLVTRFPDSKAAALARVRLGELTPGRASAKAIVPSAAKEATASGHSPAWEQELRRNAAIQERLRRDAGDRVFFAAGSAELGARARAAISAQAQWLKQWREFEAAIEGHADDPGTGTENLRLSEARAKVVRQRLVEEGVDPKRVAVVAMGSSDRIAPCGDSACAAQNRRVVTLVFAAGTRERLGLAPIESAEAPEPAAAAGTNRPAPVGERRPAAKPVGLTR